LFFVVFVFLTFDGLFFYYGLFEGSWFRAIPEFFRVAANGWSFNGEEFLAEFPFV
jgi:hypothetical protein